MKLKLSMVLVLIYGLGFSQNVNFENWSTTAISQDSLDNWSSTNHAIHAVTSTITSLYKSNDAAAGNHAALIQTAPFGIAAAPVVGIMVNGNAKLSFDAVSTKYVSGGGVAFGLKPPSLNGKYKIMGNYDGLIHVLLSQYNSSTQQRDTIGFGSLLLSSFNSTYTSFSIPINYQSVNTPDTLTIIVYASDPSIVPGINSSFSSLFIDDFWFFPNFVNDVGILSIESPTSSTPVNTPDTVSAWIKNIGNTVQTGFNISYTENGSNKVQETFSDTLYANDSVLFKFSQLFMAKHPGQDTICVFLENVLNDGNPTNDTMCVVASNALSVEQHQLNPLKIYPNPNQGLFVIDALRKGKAEVYTSSGQLIKTIGILPGENSVDLSKYPNGLYYLHMDDLTERLSIIH